MLALKLPLIFASSLLLIYGLLIAVVWWQQERLIFQPERLAADHRFAFGSDVHEVWVDVPGAQLNALHLQLPQPAGVVFFLHGNAGNLNDWFVNADFYRGLNLDLYMIDYRGYGKSSGRIESQQELEADVRAAWAAIAPRYAGLRRVVAGRSLGSALAAQLAAEIQPDMTLLISPYESMSALAREHYRWVPPFVLRYPLSTADALARVRTPVLLVHGTRDELIAPAHSERLLKAAPQATHLLIEGAGHNDLQAFPAYFDGLAAALKP